MFFLFQGSFWKLSPQGIHPGQLSQTVRTMNVTDHCPVNVGRESSAHKTAGEVPAVQPPLRQMPPSSLISHSMEWMNKD